MKLDDSTVRKMLQAKGNLRSNTLEPFKSKRAKAGTKEESMAHAILARRAELHHLNENKLQGET